MPIFDVRCLKGHDAEFIGTSAQIGTHRCDCGEPVERLFTISRVQVRDDSIPGGMTIENMGPTPLTFYSHTDHRRAMAKRGLEPRVRHIGTPGSDRSRETTRWV